MKDKILACVTVVVALVFIYSLVFIKPEFNVTFNENNDSDLVNVEVIKKVRRRLSQEILKRKAILLNTGNLMGKSMILMKELLVILL